MKQILNAFHADDSGAITVDWVALTAAIVVLALLIMGTVGGAAQSTADWLRTTMESMM